MPDAGSATTSRSCPACGDRVPIHAGYVSWCECGWGLTQPETGERRRLLADLYLRIGERRGALLFESLKGRPAVRPGLGGLEVVLFVLSGLVLLAYVSSIAFGIWLLVHHWPNVLTTAAALTILLAAYVGRPRPYRVPRDGVVARDAHPALYRFVEDVAAAVGTRPPHRVVVNEEFNASVVQAGWASERVLVLGLPLFAYLRADERVALLGHEMSHLVNGDCTRGRVTGVAWDLLHGLCEFLTPRSAYEAGDTGAGMASIVLLRILAIGPRSVAWLFAHLAWRDGQQAEYYADRLGAEVSGSAGFVGMLEELHGGSILELAVHRVAHGVTERGVFGELRHLHATRPERERERLRRLAADERYALDATHPPTGRRIDMLRIRASDCQRYVLSESHEAEIEAELSSMTSAIEEKLVNDYRSALHGL